MTDSWEEHATWWIDGFTDGADPEYEDQILPLAESELAAARRVIDVGCGEGQIGRRAAAGGAVVVGVDPTSTHLATARERAGGPTYVRGSATSLPFPDATFDHAVACLVLEHIDDLDDAIAEVSRVLALDGRLCVFLNHPLVQTPGSAWVDDHAVDPPEQYWRLGPYLVESDSLEQVQRGVWIRFLHRPLSRYVNAFADHGLVIERMVESSPPTRFRQLAPGYEAAAAYPRLLYLRLRRT